MSRASEIADLHARIVTSGSERFLHKLGKKYSRARRKSGAPSVVNRLQISANLQHGDQTRQLAEFLYVMARGGKHPHGDIEKGDTTLATLLFGSSPPRPTQRRLNNDPREPLAHHQAATAIKQANALIQQQQEEEIEHERKEDQERARSPSPEPLPELTTVELLLLGAIPVTEQSDADLLAFIQHVVSSGEPDGATAASVTIDTPRQALLGFSKQFVAVPAPIIEARAMEMAHGDPRRASVIVDVIARTIRKIQSQVRAIGQSVDELLLATDRIIPNARMTPGQKEKTTELIAELRKLRNEAQAELEAGGEVNGELLALAGAPSDGQRAARSLGYGSKVRSFLQRNERTIKIGGAVVGAVVVAAILVYTRQQLLRLYSLRTLGILAIPETPPDPKTFQRQRVKQAGLWNYDPVPYPSPGNAPYDYGRLGHDLAEMFLPTLQEWLVQAKPRLEEMKKDPEQELKNDRIFMIDTLEGMNTPKSKILISLMFDAYLRVNEPKTRILVSLLDYMSNSCETQKFMAEVIVFYRKKMLRTNVTISELLMQVASFMSSNSQITAEDKNLEDGKGCVNGGDVKLEDMKKFYSMAIGKPDSANHPQVPYNSPPVPYSQAIMFFVETDALMIMQTFELPE
jgi:hypothetical protein